MKAQKKFRRQALHSTLCRRLSAEPRLLFGVLVLQICGSACHWFTTALPFYRSSARRRGSNQRRRQAAEKASSSSIPKKQSNDAMIGNKPEQKMLALPSCSPKANITSNICDTHADDPPGPFLNQTAIPPPPPPRHEAPAPVWNYSNPQNANFVLRNDGEIMAQQQGQPDPAGRVVPPPPPPPPLPHSRQIISSSASSVQPTRIPASGPTDSNVYQSTNRDASLSIKNTFLETSHTSKQQYPAHRFETHNLERQGSSDWKARVHRAGPLSKSGFISRHHRTSKRLLPSYLKERGGTSLVRPNHRRRRYPRGIRPSTHWQDPPSRDFDSHYRRVDASIETQQCQKPISRGGPQMLDRSSDAEEDELAESGQMEGDFFALDGDPCATLTLEDWLGPCTGLSFGCSTKANFGIASHPAFSSAVYWMSQVEDGKFQRCIRKDELLAKEERLVLKKTRQKLCSLRKKRRESSTQTVRVCRRQPVPIIALLMAEGRLEDDVDLNLSDDEFEQLVKQLAGGPVYEEYDEQVPVDSTVAEECSLEIELAQRSSKLAKFPRRVSLPKSWSLDAENLLFPFELVDPTEELSDFEERLLHAAEIREDDLLQDTVVHGDEDNDDGDEDVFNCGDLWILMEASAFDFVRDQERKGSTESHGHLTTNIRARCRIS